MKRIDITTMSPRAMRSWAMSHHPDTSIARPYNAFTCPTACFARVWFAEDDVDMAVWVLGSVLHVWRVKTDPTNSTDAQAQYDRYPILDWSIALEETVDAVCVGQLITAGMLIEILDRMDRTKGVKVA